VIYATANGSASDSRPDYLAVYSTLRFTNSNLFYPSPFQSWT